MITTRDEMKSKLKHESTETRVCISLRASSDTFFSEIHFFNFFSSILFFLYSFFFLTLSDSL